MANNPNAPAQAPPATAPAAPAAPTIHPPASSAPPAPPAPEAPAAPTIAPKGTTPRLTVVPAVPFNILTNVKRSPRRIMVFGTGGVGKTTAAAALPGAFFFDLDDGAETITPNRDTASKWMEFRGKLTSFANSPPVGCRTVVIDNLSRAEELAKDYVVETRTTDGGNRVQSIEGFGWGKGWKYVYEEFLGMMADLDRIRSKGIIVCMIAHVVATPVPHPAGEDFMRWEPLLYAGDKKGNSSIRDYAKNWADDVVFIGYDVAVEQGKGTGSGTRYFSTLETPTHIAKSRDNQINNKPFYKNDPGAMWRELGIS